MTPATGLEHYPQYTHYTHYTHYAHYPHYPHYPLDDGEPAVQPCWMPYVTADVFDASPMR